MRLVVTLVPFGASLVASLLLPDEEARPVCPLPRVVRPIPAEAWADSSVVPAVDGSAESVGGWPFSILAIPDRRERERRSEQLERRLASAVPWSERLTRKENLTIRAETWPVFDLFPEVLAVPVGVDPDRLVETGEVGSRAGRLDLPVEGPLVARSPSGQFAYIKRILPRGEWLDLGRESAVSFDADVPIPAVWERREGRNPRLWMSHTPFEVITLMGGISTSRGVVVVAGLGLGWQLVRIANRPKVTRVILVERSQDLVDWLMPRLLPLLPPGKVEVVVGDAYEVLPSLQADVAVVDVWPDYGDIGLDLAKMEGCSAGIGRFWGWGTGWKGSRDYGYWVRRYRSKAWK